MGILDLPDEVLLHIVQSVRHARGVARVAQTCRRLSAIAGADAVWRPLVCHRFLPPLLPPSAPEFASHSTRGHRASRPARSARRRRTSATSRLPLPASHAREWKRLYNILLAWRRGTYRVAPLAPISPALPSLTLPEPSPKHSARQDNRAPYPAGRPLVRAAGKLLAVAAPRSCTVSIFSLESIGSSSGSAPAVPTQPPVVLSAPEDGWGIVEQLAVDAAIGAHEADVACVWSGGVAVYRVRVPSLTQDHDGAGASASLASSVVYKLETARLDNVSKRSCGCALSAGVLALLGSDGRLLIFRVSGRASADAWPVEDKTLPLVLRFAGPDLRSTLGAEGEAHVHLAVSCLRDMNENKDAACMWLSEQPGNVYDDHLNRPQSAGRRRHDAHVAPELPVHVVCTLAWTAPGAPGCTPLVHAQHISIGLPPTGPDPRPSAHQQGTASDLSATVLSNQHTTTTLFAFPRTQTSHRLLSDTERERGAGPASAVSRTAVDPGAFPIRDNWARRAAASTAPFHEAWREGEPASPASSQSWASCLPEERGHVRRATHPRPPSPSPSPHPYPELLSDLSPRSPSGAAPMAHACDGADDAGVPGGDPSSRMVPCALALAPPYLFAASGHGVELLHLHSYLNSQPGTHSARPHSQQEEAGGAATMAQRQAGGTRMRFGLETVWSTPAAHTGDVQCVSISTYLGRAMSSAADGTLRVWPLPSQHRPIRRPTSGEGVAPNPAACLSVRPTASGYASREQAQEGRADSLGRCRPSVLSGITDWAFDAVVATPGSDSVPGLRGAGGSGSPTPSCEGELGQPQVWRLGME